jgi:Type ISP C-terminal specificity domain
VDVRFADRIRPGLCLAFGDRQVHMTTLMTTALGAGPAATVTHLLPDMHHFRGSFGGKDVIPLWANAAADRANIAYGLLGRLTAALGSSVGADEPFAYGYAVLANPTFTHRLWEELAAPGPRLPITRDLSLFRRGVELDRRLIYLHTFGERMRPVWQPAGVPQGRARCLRPIPDDPRRYPEDFAYIPEEQAIRVGETGKFGPAAPEVFAFTVSGFEVVKSWLAYRMRERAGRRSSPLDDIRPERWTAQMTDEFLELLGVLEHTLALYPDLDAWLDAVLAGPCFTAAELPVPCEAKREPPSRNSDSRQGALV